MDQNQAPDFDGRILGFLKGPSWVNDVFGVISWDPERVCLTIPGASRLSRCSIGRDNDFQTLRQPCSFPEKRYIKIWIRLKVVDNGAEPCIVFGQPFVIHILRELVSGPFILTVECREIELVNRIAVESSFVFDYRVNGHRSSRCCDRVNLKTYPRTGPIPLLFLI